MQAHVAETVPLNQYQRPALEVSAVIFAENPNLFSSNSGPPGPTPYGEKIIYNIFNYLSKPSQLRAFSSYTSSICKLREIHLLS